MLNLSKETKVTLVQAPLADGQTDPDSSSVDMLGFEGVMFIGIAGTITGNGTVSLKASQSSNNADFNDLSGIVATTVAASDDDSFLLLDVYRPTDRYVRTTLTRAVDNSVYGGTIAIQYGAHTQPTVHDAATLAVAAVLGISPAEA
jgi:hypothetical protein